MEGIDSSSARFDSIACNRIHIRSTPPSICVEFGKNGVCSKRPELGDGGGVKQHDEEQTVMIQSAAKVQMVEEWVVHV